MKKTILFFQVVLVCLLVGCKPAPNSGLLSDEIKYVDPFIGTGFHGHTFPGADLPLSPSKAARDAKKLVRKPGRAFLHTKWDTACAMPWQQL